MSWEAAFVATSALIQESYSVMPESIGEEGFIRASFVLASKSAQLGLVYDELVFALRAERTSAYVGNIVTAFRSPRRAARARAIGGIAGEIRIDIKKACLR